VRWTKAIQVGLGLVLVCGVALASYVVVVDRRGDEPDARAMVAAMRADPEFKRYFAGGSLPSMAKLDTDGDGIPDVRDRDIDGDGIPNERDPDIDGDGIPNESDPTTAVISLLRLVERRTTVERTTEQQTIRETETAGSAPAPAPGVETVAVVD
jgi:hypothetical protein